LKGLGVPCKQVDPLFYLPSFVISFPRVSKVWNGHFSWQTLQASLSFLFTHHLLLYLVALLEILSVATNHYATGMQLVVVCNYFGHVYNYKFGIV
jgi:hypothetical protein